jgi:hypothetical protein
VQPSSIGPFGFGTSVRASNGSTTLPGASTMTNFFARNPEEVALIKESGRKIAMTCYSCRVHQLCLRCRGRLPDDHHRLGNPGCHGAFNEAGRASLYSHPLLYLGIWARRNDRCVDSRTAQSTPRPVCRLRQNDSCRSYATDVQLRRHAPRSPCILVERDSRNPLMRHRYLASWSARVAHQLTESVDTCRLQGTNLVWKSGVGDLA